MREKILANIRDINPWIFTGIAVILAVVLTTGLNYFFAWLNGGTISPRVFMYATIDAILIPLIIAPIIINMLKRTINLEQEKQQLEGAADAYIASDDIEVGFGNKIPLYLFGFLY